MKKWRNSHAYELVRHNPVLAILTVLLSGALIISCEVDIGDTQGQVETRREQIEDEINEIENYRWLKINIVMLHLEGQAWNTIGVLVGGLEPDLVQAIYNRDDRWAANTEEVYYNRRVPLIKDRMAVIYAEQKVIASAQGNITPLR